MGKLAVGAAVACVATVGQAEAKVARGKRAIGAGAPGKEGLGRVEAKSHAPASMRSAGPTVTDAAAFDVTPPAPWGLVKPLAMGSTVAPGWRVADMTGVANGSFVVTLENARGRSHRVHVCRNDGRPQGLVYTDRFDLVVMNEGRGDLPTEEGLAQAVAEVAHALAANERERRHEPLVTALLPQSERVQRFAAAARLR